VNIIKSANRATLLAGCALGLGISAAHAQTAPTANAQLTTGTAQNLPATTPPTDLLHRKLLTGDWDGGRTKLKAAGITITGFYTGEFADALSGGKRTGNGIASQFGLGADADLGKLAGLEGGTLHIMFNQRVGRNVSGDDIGNKLAVQEVYGAGETLRIVEFSYEQKLAADQVITKIGFYPMGNDFAFTPLLCAFQNVGFCAHPQNLPNSSGWSDSPTGKWGGRIKYLPTPDLYIMTGAFDVNPSYSSKIHGLKTSLSGSTGALVPLEAGLTTAFGAAALPGHYKAGVYYDTSDVADAATAKQIDSGRYGAYLLADQMVVSFNNTPKRGLIAFAQVSYSDPRTAVFESAFDAGVIAQGPLDARPQDFLALGYVRAGLNNRTVNAKEAASHGKLTDLSDGEGAVELGYGLQATPWLLVHPNIQYITDPGTFAYKHIANAWAFGLQTKVVF
jgi:porin